MSIKPFSCYLLVGQTPENENAREREPWGWSLWGAARIGSAADVVRISTGQIYQSEQWKNEKWGRTWYEKE